MKLSAKAFIPREKITKYQFFTEVVLRKDIPEKRLRKGDVATVVEYHAARTSEDGYSLVVFNALGDTIAVATVSESDIEHLKGDEVLSVRPLKVA